jgi:predicted nuclease of predicted toxin-antitoxin system
LRLFIDQNLSGDLVGILAEAAHDAVHAMALGLERAPDPEILGFCCVDRRTLVSADKKLTKYLASSVAQCPSVVVVRDVRTLHAADLGHLLVANLATIEAAIEEHGNAVFTIAPSKPIRAMVLPLRLTAEG